MSQPGGSWEGTGDKAQPHLKVSPENGPVKIQARSAARSDFIREVRKQGFFKKIILLGFPGGAVVENLSANAGDMGSSPGLGRSHMPRSN